MIALDNVGVESSPPARPPRRSRAWLGGLLAVVVLVVAVASVSYRVGVHVGHTVTVRTGEAWSSGQQASVTSHGVVYNVPLGADSDWYGEGSDHLGGTPACLPPLRLVRITFATAAVYENGALNSTVVWVRC